MYVTFRPPVCDCDDSPVLVTTYHSKCKPYGSETTPPFDSLDFVWSERFSGVLVDERVHLGRLGYLAGSLVLALDSHLELALGVDLVVVRLQSVDVFLLYV